MKALNRLYFICICKAFSQSKNSGILNAFISPDEFLSGLKKEEKLIPVVTITIYWGTERWDGSRSIHDMLPPMDEQLQKYVANYQLNLIVPEEIKDFSKFHSMLGPVLKLFQLAEQKTEFQEDEEAEGLMSRLVELAIRRFKKGDTAEEVAELFEEDLSLIQKIYDYWKSQTSECDVEKISNALLYT